MLGYKLRFRFAKTGTLRLLSHHDLMRCLERMLRRADIPFKSTAGFHPTPRFVFALSLPLGVVGRDEVVEVELTRPLDSDHVLALLNAQAPAGLTFTRASVVPMNATAISRHVVYKFPITTDRLVETGNRADGLMGAEKVWVDRLRPSPKRLNIRPYLRRIECFAVADDEWTLASGPEHFVALDLWVTQTGTARAEELIRLLNLTDLLDAGAVLERTHVELRDEVPDTDPNDRPPDGPADVLPLEPAAVAALSRREDDANQLAVAHRGPSPGGPVVE
jgi:radical SAM-linked protein